MREKLVLVSRDGPKANVLKIKPPIVFNKENVDVLVDRLKETLDELLSEWSICSWYKYFILICNIDRE